MSDSLEKNPFYRSLMTQFQDLFAIAGKECSMICVPRSSSLKGVSLNKQFLSSHLLKQSPLLKSHLVPLDTSQVTDVEVRKGKLFVTNKKCGKIHEVDIISSEDAFNDENKMYQINVIDRPMTYPLIESVHQFGTDDTDIVTVTSLNECKLYLMQISSQKFRQLVNAAEQFSTTLTTITPNNLDEVSDKSASLVEDGIRMFGVNDITVDEDIVKYSVESVVISFLVDDLMNSIHAKYRGVIERLHQQMDLIRRKRLSLKSLGSQFDFRMDSSGFNGKEILSRLNSTYTPIEKVTVFKNVVSSIRNQLETLVQESRSPFDILPPLPVLSEDLIAATVLVLVHTEHAQVFCHLKFVQLFGNQLPSTDEMAFSVVTIEAAFQVIQHFDSFSASTKQVLNQRSKDVQKTSLRESPELDTSQNLHDTRKKVDPLFDRELRRLNKLLDDVKTGDIISSAASARTRVSSEDINSSAVSARTRASSEDDDLGEFLSSLQVSKFHVNQALSALDTFSQLLRTSLPLSVS